MPSHHVTRSPATPVIIAANVSRTDERRWSGPLSALADGMAQMGHDDPVVIGIGRVFAGVNAASASDFAATPALAVG